MAHYTRFEIYIPVVYVIEEVDPKTKRPTLVTHALDDGVLRRFIEEAMARYRGLTQANPLAPALYKGWWKENAERPISIDYLTYLFG